MDIPATQITGNPRHGPGPAPSVHTRPRALSITRESQIIALICLADLAATLVLLSHCNVREGNPVMGFYLQWGVCAFVAAKLGLLFFPILVAAWCAQFQPVFTKKMLRFAIVAYVGLYGLLFLHHNVPVLLADVSSPRIAATQAAASAHPGAQK